jgi:hypothetical protein
MKLEDGIGVVGGGVCGGVVFDTFLVSAGRRS